MVTICLPHDVVNAVCHLLDTQARRAVILLTPGHIRPLNPGDINSVINGILFCGDTGESDTGHSGGIFHITDVCDDISGDFFGREVARTQDISGGSSVYRRIGGIASGRRQLHARHIISAVGGINICGIHSRDPGVINDRFAVGNGLGDIIGGGVGGITVGDMGLAAVGYADIGLDVINGSLCGKRTFMRVVFVPDGVGINSIDFSLFGDNSGDICELFGLPPHTGQWSMAGICVDSGSEDSVNGLGVQRRTKNRARLRVGNQVRVIIWHA